MDNGKILIFEGIDGSGKGTQSKLLYKYYQANNIPSILFEFPAYSKTFFGKTVGEFLNGDFGTLEEVHPKLSAMLYAGDRFEQVEEIKNYLSKGYIVICDRYIPSNIAHQIAKVSHSQQKALKKWIEHLEYEIFQLPKPDLIFFLNMPPLSASKLVLKKEQRDYTDKKKDIHEENQSYLEKVYAIFQNISIEEKWLVIECKDKNIETVHSEILNQLN